jgi:hypothetical protein
MVDSEDLRTRARELTIKARAAESGEEKIALTSRAKSYLLLAKSAEWLQSTDEFLKAIESGKSWPYPKSGLSPEARRVVHRSLADNLRSPASAPLEGCVPEKPHGVARLLTQAADST